MSNRTVRSRIAMSFAGVILIFGAVGTLSYLELKSIHQKAEVIGKHVMPASYALSEIRVVARDAFFNMDEEAGAETAEQRVDASKAVEPIIAQLIRWEETFDSTVREGQADEFNLVSRVKASRKRLTDSYHAAKSDKVLTEEELTGVPLTEFVQYTALLDSLLAMTNRSGKDAASDIQASSSSAELGGLVGLAVAIIIAVFCALWLARVIDRPLVQLMEVTSVMRTGNFKQRINLNGRDEFGLLGERINLMADDLTSLIGQVQLSGMQVNSSVTEIAATSRQQQATATEIAATTSEVSATALRISSTSKELVHAMKDVAAVADKTATLAGSGQSGLQEMEGTMRQIMDASTSINDRLATLSEKAGRIGTVVTTINKVADQTNLLSLNAAIEAEKAGEHGRGFAVVATEIRRLADQTAVATDDIEQIVKEIQSAVSAGVMGMDKFADEVRRGTDAVSQATVQLSEIIRHVKELNPNLVTVNEGMQSQSEGAQEISEALSQLSVSAQQTADSLRQSNSAIEQLNGAALGLQSGISRFALTS